MKRITKLISIMALLVLFLLPAAPAHAMGPFDGGPVIFGGNYTLASGEILDGDVVVFGGNVVIEMEALVNGSIVVFGGSISIEGTVRDDVVLIGGSGSMGEQAVIRGDLVTVGGSMVRAEGARVEGEVRQESAIEIPIPSAPTVPEVPQVPQFQPMDTSNVPGAPEFLNFLDPIGSAVNVLVQAVLMGALAMLLILFMRPQMERVGQTAIINPLMTGGVGLLAVLALIIAALILVITLVGPLLVAILFLAAWLFGIVSLGLEAGERFTRAIGQEWPAVWVAGFGTFLVVLISQGIGLVDCVGWLVPFLLGVVGIGAVTLTIFNARMANRPAAAVPAPGPDDALPPPA